MLRPTDPGTAAGVELVQRRRELLQRSGVTQATVAARAGVSRQSVGLVLAGHHRSRHVEQAIADACGVLREDLFPAGDGAAAAGRVPAGTAVGLSSSVPRDSTPEPRPVSAVASDARDEPGELVAAVEVAAVPLEERVTAELRRIAEEVFLAVAGEGLATSSPVVRAAAAALRELGASASSRR